MRINKFVSFLVLIGSAFSAHAELPVHGYKVVNVYPHNVNDFTQGLLVENGVITESTGLWGQSRVFKYHLRSQTPGAKHRLDKKYFGEGIALARGHIFQLTYKSGQGFIYAASDLRKTGEFNYRGEGWGLTFDGTNLIMSDGSPRLTFLDVDQFRFKRKCLVKAEQSPVLNLNELEYVNGMIYANIWRQETIARIDPRTCQVKDWINLAGLLTTSERQKADVLNGIAYDAVKKRLYVTGKFWPKMFEIEIIEKSPAP